MAEPGVNFSEIILDEICLEGLDGITIQALWVRLSERFQFEVPDHLKERFWNITANLKDVNMFTIPEPREDLMPFQRFINIKGKYVLKPPIKDDPQIAIYPYEPVKEGHGSCKFFDTRIDVTLICRLTTYKEAVERWGNRLVIVGVLEARWKALAPCSPPVFDNITRTQFSLLERIGRTRYNGETSVSIQTGQDPKALFPHRKILLRLKLIKKRPFTQRDDKSNVSCRLLHLPRFYRPYMSNIETAIELIISTLKKWPNNMAPYQEIKEVITAHDPRMVTKNVLKLNEFTKIGQCLTVTYRELFPNAKDEEAISAYNGSDRLVRVIKLLEQEDNQEDQDIDEWEVTGSGYVGETLLRQVYLCMHESGPAGITQREVAENLGLDCLTARLALKHIDKKCNIHKSMIDIKRQRMAKFTCPEFVGLSVDEVDGKSKNQKVSTIPAKNKAISNVVLDNLKTVKDENNPPEAAASTSQAVDKALPCLNVLTEANNCSRDKMTPTKLRRTQFILDQLRQRHIIYDTTNILKMCNQQESASGYKNGIIDKKTILRILARLENQGLLRLIYVKLGKFAAPKLTFICEPHIESNHSYIQSVVEQAKMVYLSKSSKKMPQEIKSKQLSLKVAEVKKIYGFVPKFSKMRSLHEFLFYIVYGHENKIGDLEQLISKSLINDLLKKEVSQAYENAPEKYLFVPPAPEHTNWPRGWMLLADVLLCMPLHIFMKIVRVPVFTPILVEYVKHPLKCQILIKNLPIDIQNLLFCKRRHVFSIYEVVERLCLFGLVRFGQRIMKDKDRIFVFLNRTTSLLDTTGSSPSYVTVEDKNYIREFFAFQNGLDISNYWNRLQIICLNTQLGFSKQFVGTQVEIQNAEAKMSNELRSFSIEEVVELDNATVPGDSKGAAGLDSSLFSHIRRSWLTLLPMKAVKRKQAEKIASQMAPVSRKKPKIARNLAHPINPVPIKKKGKHFVRTIAKRKTARVRKPFYDDVDKVALKNLTTLRSCWQPKEDRVLHLCKTATGIMFANPRLAPSAIIRDMLHVATRIVDKTSAACRRRLLYMTKNSQISHKIQLCLAEVKQDDFIIKKYSHFYNRKRVVESSPKYPDFVREYKIHFIELVQFLHKHMYGKTDTRLSSIRLPNTLVDLNQKFNVDIPEHATSPDEVMEPETTLEINQNALTTVIHSALSCRSGKKSQAYQLLQIYRQFPETLLRDTILKIKSSGMFAMTKKYSENERLSTYSTSFHLSQSYLYQLCTATPYTMFTEIYQHCMSMMHSKSKKFSPEVLDSGITALLTELTSSGRADLDLIFPENLLIMDPKNVDKLESDKNSPNEQKNSSVFMDEEKLHPSRISFSLLQLPETPAPVTQDSLVVSSCELSVTLNSDLSEFHLSEEKINELVNNLTRDAVYTTDSSNEADTISMLKDCDVNLAKRVFDFIDKIGQVGAQAIEIKNAFSSFDLFSLEKVLVALKNTYFIFHVGIVNSRWVSREHFQDWYIKLDFEAGKIHHISRKDNDDFLLNSAMDDEKDIQKRKRLNSLSGPESKKLKKESNYSAESTEEIEKNLKTGEDSGSGEGEDDTKVKASGTTYFCPNPWISPDGVLNLRILWRWTGAILGFLISHPLINLSLLQQRFSYMTPFHIRILVEVMTKLGCTEIYLIPRKKTSLWDNERCTTIVKEKVSLLHSNEEIFVEISDNAIVKLALYKGLSMKLQKQLESK